MQPVVDLAEIETQNAVLRSCSAETCAALLERGTLQVVDSGTLLCKEGDTSAVGLFPLRGKLQLSKTARNGRRQVLCYMDPATCIGVCLLLTTERCMADVLAVEPGLVLTVAREDLAEVALQDPALGVEMWQGTVRCLSHFLGLVENLSFHKVNERVVLALLDGTAADGAVLRRTQAELAAEIGTTREVVARCLAELQQAGAIKLGRGKISVLDRESLQKLI